ncbi:MAG: DUF2842 domain-containing protein [Parasphingorhabdus sp.]
MTTEKDNKFQDQPSWRKPVGMIFILLLILIWTGVSVTLIEALGDLNFWLLMPIYAILGIAWIFPMKPLITWMTTGKFRHHT